MLTSWRGLSLGTHTRKTNHDKKKYQADNLYFPWFIVSSPSRLPPPPLPSASHHLSPCPHLCSSSPRTTPVPATIPPSPATAPGFTTSLPRQITSRQQVRLPLHGNISAHLLVYNINLILYNAINLSVIITELSACLCNRYLHDKTEINLLENRPALFKARWSLKWQNPQNYQLKLFGAGVQACWWQVSQARLARWSSRVNVESPSSVLRFFFFR